MNRIFIVSLVFLASSIVAFAQVATDRAREDPYVCLEAARDGFTLTDESLMKIKVDKVPDDILEKLERIKDRTFTKESFLRELKTAIGLEAGSKYQSLVLRSAEISNSLSDMRAKIDSLLNRKPSDAPSLCKLAELMKRVGDTRAEYYYKEAIKQLPDEPAYELFFADYLRNVRGAQRPLFSEAEEHYFEGERKLEQITYKQPFDRATGQRLERGVIALYQEDGLALFHRKSNAIDQSRFIERPFWFYSLINRVARSTSDTDRVDDMRSFTSEALFSSSKTRLNRSLTEAELEKIVRAKSALETLNRFRFRYKGAPAFDVFYRYKNIKDAQITDFSKPNEFNDVQLREYGFSVEKSINLYPYFDLSLKGAYKKADRQGIIEFSPRAPENIDQYEASAALSRFAGPDKVNFDLAYVFQDINPQISNPDKRERTIVAGKFTYQLLRPIAILQSVYENRFETRGLDLSIGSLYDRELFGALDVTKKDYFAVIALKGLGAFDISLQPTVFTSNVEGDRSQRNSQYRTNVVLLYRIIDEEAHPGITDEKGKFHTAFLHLVFPFKHDVAIDGPKHFENTRIGVELDAKLFNTGFRKTTFLTSLRYEYQRFHNLNKSLSLFTFNISMGF